MKIVCAILILTSIAFSNSYINPFTGERDNYHPEYLLKSDQYLTDIYNYDVNHYEYFIDVTDTVNAAVDGYARFDIITTAEIDTFIFDLKDQLIVDSVFHLDQEVDQDNIRRENDRTYVYLVNGLNSGVETSFKVYYHGVPPEGSYF